jgi:hypothetical protein
MGAIPIGALTHQYDRQGRPHRIELLYQLKAVLHAAGNPSASSDLIRLHYSDLISDKPFDAATSIRSVISFELL